MQTRIVKRADGTEIEIEVVEVPLIGDVAESNSLTGSGDDSESDGSASVIEVPEDCFTSVPAKALKVTPTGANSRDSGRLWLGNLVLFGFGFFLGRKLRDGGDPPAI